MNAYLETLIEQRNDYKKSISMPIEIREFLISRLPSKMMCSSTLKSGEVKTYRLDKNKALSYEHIQVNHPNLYSFIVIDDDGIEPDNYLDLPIAPPNLIVINPKTGHSQKWYFLKEGVTRTRFGSQQAKDYYAKTVFKMTAIYNGDVHYTGYLARNPFSKRHIVFCPEIEPYTLNELNDAMGVTADDYASGNKYKSDAFLLIREYCHRNKKLSEASGIGRNCETFEILRHQAYREWYEFNDVDQFQTYLESVATKINQNRFANNLLPNSEIKSISKSIANYCFSRRIKTTSNIKSFSDRQKSRGKLGGLAKSKNFDEARAKFTNLFVQNPQLKTKQLAIECGVSERTIRRYKKEIEPKLEAISELIPSARKPVFDEENLDDLGNSDLAKKLGVSVRTIQRRRAKAKMNAAQEINKAIDEEAQDKIKEGGDKADNSLFSWLHVVPVLNKEYMFFQFFNLSQIPFIYPCRNNSR